MQISPASQRASAAFQQGFPGFVAVALSSAAATHSASNKHCVYGPVCCIVNTALRNPLKGDVYADIDCTSVVDPSWILLLLSLFSLPLLSTISSSLPSIIIIIFLSREI